jgi:PadR family transcriptional regulator, regulatory protein AphA
METLEAYPITYGMLGLLAVWGPLSGYDLKHVCDQVLAPMWGVVQSQVYKELRRMQELGWVEMEREEQESRPDRKVYSVTSKGYTALRSWQAQPPEVFQIRDELLLKVLFGSFATPSDLARNLRASITEHEMRLLAYRQNLPVLPLKGAFRHDNQRPNPYGASSQEDPYLTLIARFAIAFENTYLHWLYEALEVVESGEKQAPEGEA